MLAYSGKIEKFRQALHNNGGFLQLLSRAWSIARAEGFSGLLLRAGFKTNFSSPFSQSLFLTPEIRTVFNEQYVYFPPDLTAEIRNDLLLLKKNGPLFSIVTPTYNTPPDVLEEMIDSILRQWYDSWELCIVDDGSSNPETIDILKKLEKRNEQRFHIRYLEKNSGIANASNEASRLASGEYLVLLDHDDLLTPDALYEAARAIRDTNADYLYSDEDKIDQNGKYSNPFFKPDWSPETFMSIMYVCHLSVIRRRVFSEIGGFRDGYNGAQDYDLILRASEKWNKVHHIPRVLYHWRCLPLSLAESAHAKPYAFESVKKSKLDALKRRGLDGRLENVDAMPGQYRVLYHPDPSSRISIIIPTRDRLIDLRRCVDSIQRLSTWKNFEIIIADNDSGDTSVLSYLNSLQEKSVARVISTPGDFNFSRINNIAAENSDGNFLLFLNNDTEILTPDWMERMLGLSQLSHVGAVGAKLLFPGGKIQHCGLVNLADGPGHAFYNKDSEFPYENGRTLLDYNWLAVTAACMLISKEKFNALGGFDEDFPISYNDVELCFRLHEKNYTNVVASSAVLRHFESRSRGVDHKNTIKKTRLEKERRLLYSKHPSFFMKDPYVNPNLNPNSIDLKHLW